ncbi:hypothetical protein [Streptomyces sp. CB03911]|uniref:hypothetical protein n=1 Tax=Streptomycetaceae TaxID=2062 RepID=UPI0018FEA5DE|nr:hypothetical protein [Streptomyces sp. CB03911]
MRIHPVGPERPGIENSRERLRATSGSRVWQVGRQSTTGIRLGWRPFECLIDKLKAWWDIDNRFDKTSESDLAGLYLRTSTIWIKGLAKTTP